MPKRISLPARWWRTVRRWTASLLKPKTLGRRGEDAAALFLRARGYIIVARSYRTALGEIDLVAVDGQTVVFVEVKTRVRNSHGEPHEAVHSEKQQRLTRLAIAYRKRHDLTRYSCRFDVVSILWPEPRKSPQIEHFKNAFEAAGESPFT